MGTSMLRSRLAHGPAFDRAYELGRRLENRRAGIRSSIIRLSGNWRGNLKTPKLPKAFRSSTATLRPRSPYGLPRDTIARLVREAPLHSLSIAFLIGLVIAGRR